METFAGILFFTSGFVTCAAVSGLLFVVHALRGRDQVLDKTAAWTSDVLRGVRWPSNEAAQRATEP